MRPSRAWALALGAAAVAFAAHRALAPMGETDLFFHLAIGQRILAEHRIPFANLFSFTYPDHPDPDLAWGFQALVALLYRIGGFAAIVLAKVALFAGAIALSVRAIRRAVGAGGSDDPARRSIAAAAATAAAVCAAMPRIVERPHLVTFVGLGAIALCAVEVERGRPRAIWLVPAIAAVWANFHAGVFFAPIWLALWLGGAWLDHRRGQPIALPRARSAVAALSLTAAACFASPGGRFLPGYLGWHTGLGSTRVIDEFRRADPWNDPWLFALAAGALLALLALRRETPLRRALPALMLLPLALRSVRFAAEWAIVAAPFLADGLARLEAALPRRAQSLARAAAALALCAAVAVERAQAPPPLRLAEGIAPREAIAFATANGLRERMYADLDVGCYLLWEGWPRYRVFQDARLPAYPDEFHRALDQTPADPAAWDALLARYGVDAALLSDPGTNLRAGSFDPAEWALVWRSGDALVWARRGERNRAVIAAHEIPLSFRVSFAEGAHAHPIPLPPPRSPVPPCEWRSRLAGALDAEAALDADRAVALDAMALDARGAALDADCLDGAAAAEVAFRLGARAQLAGRDREALLRYDRALALAPDGPRADDTLVNRGYARLRSDPAQARADFSAALARSPGRKDALDGLARLPPPAK